MTTLDWSGYQWITQERWGQLHADKPQCWYDPSAVSILEGSNWLILKTPPNPKYFDSIKKTSPYGVGLVSCTTKFNHGTFEIEAMLPSGKNLWPAFWMWSWDTWPPEIDVFEGYASTRKDTYFQFRINNPLGFWNVQTNVHYFGKDGVATSTKGKTHWMGFKSPNDNFIKYKLEWFPDRISIYYGDRMVRNIIDPLILEQFNKTSMNVVINNHIRYNIPMLNFDVSKSKFIVKYFKYTPLQ